MPTIAESQGAQSQIQAALDAGLDQISNVETVEFSQYQKFVMSQDGYVFWVATPQTLTVKGSLHYSTERQQDEDQTIGANMVILSSEQEITAFNAVAPNAMWVGTWPIGGGLALKIAFAQRGPFYEEAGVWHYSGYAVFAPLSTQLVSSPADLPSGPIVSNSLPIWLSLNAIAPVYPSFLVPDNVAPPYIVAHIVPESTTALQATPHVGPWPGQTIPDSGGSPLHQLGSWSQARDEVRLTLYGFTSQMAIAYLQSLIAASAGGEAQTAPFGFANSPVVSDAKRTQSEIAALAMKKQIVILANYHQGTADALARRLILEATIGSFSITGGRSSFGTAASSQQSQTVNASGTVLS